MEKYYRRDYSRGWLPNADSVNGPKNALLRADNLILDEYGILSLRKGLSLIYTMGSADIDGIHTVNFSGVRHRLAATGTTIYDNGADLSESVAGSGYVSFGNYMGQCYFARSTTTRKYDGSTVRNWGIDAPAGTLGQTAGDAVPTVKAGDSTTFGTFNTADQANWSAGAGSFASGTGVYNECIDLTTDADGMGDVTRTFTDADFSVYDNGFDGNDDDLISFWFKSPDPGLIDTVSLWVYLTTSVSDCYVYHWDFRNKVTRPTSDTWVQLTAKRGDFIRYGATAGKDWSTVNDVTLAVACTQGAVVVSFDQFIITGGSQGPLGITDSAETNRYQYCYIYVRNADGYEAKSGPGGWSAPIDLANSGCVITIPETIRNSMDSQVNEIWIYRSGGMLDQPYRVGAITANYGYYTDYTCTWEADDYTTYGFRFCFTCPWESAYVINDVLATVAVSNHTADWEDEYIGNLVFNDIVSDAEAISIGLTLDDDVTTPPDNIIAIEGPHYDRLFVLDAQNLYPSRRLNPDGFAVDQVIKVCGPDEEAFWLKKSVQALYIGTSKDIYRIEGDGSESETGINFTKIPLNLGNPPVAAGVATEGNYIFYLASDGWRHFNGFTSEPVPRNDVDLLYRGYTRHGVYPVDLEESPDEFRAAISKGILTAITPEYGGRAASTTTLHRFNFTQQRWYRHTYSYWFTEIYKEPDGTVLVGDDAGHLFELDYGSQDNASAIPVILWTTADDDGKPYNRKDPLTFSIRCDTGAAAASITFMTDDASRTNYDSLLVSHGSTQVTQANGSLYIPAFQQLQLRITGSFQTFKLYDWSLDYLARPEYRLVWDSGPITTGWRDYTWVREIQLKAVAQADLTVTPYFDGDAFDPYTIVVGSDLNKATVFKVPVSREYKGKVPRIVITSGTKFEPYWVRLFVRETGNTTEKKPVEVRP